MRNLKKAAIYCILKSKDTIVNLCVEMILFVFVCFGLYSGFLKQKSVPELTLLMYVLILGSTLIVANSMIVDLTVKDKLSNRLEFFMSSGIKIKNIINSYTIQMLRVASVIPFFIFLVFYVSLDFNYNFMEMVVFYITTALLAYGEIYFFNVISFSARKNKLFKNIIFFGTFIVIYMTGMFSKEIVKFLVSVNIDIIYGLVVFNVCIFAFLLILGMIKIKGLQPI